MHNLHVWTERTPEGEKREVRARKFGKKWSIQSKLKHDEHWTYHEPALLEDLRELQDLLFRKWQRRRAAYEDVELLKKMVADRERELGLPPGGGPSGAPQPDEDE